MKSFKKWFAAGAAILAVMAFAVPITAYAATDYDSPAEAAAELTGRTVESVVAERLDTGKTFGTIAAEAGKLVEFKSEMLEQKKEVFGERVTSGSMTQEQADAAVALIEARQAVCDGTGIGTGIGIGSGLNSGVRGGAGAGSGGLGIGNGQSSNGGGQGSRGAGNGQSIGSGNGGYCPFL
jgi:hypothetical protein